MSPAIRHLLRKNHVFLWLPPVLYYGLVTYVSSLSDVGVDLPTFPYADKLLHFCEFLLLGVLISRALVWEKVIHHQKRVWRYFILLLVPLLALLDEYHQSFVPGRDVDLFDGVADVCGGVVGIYIAWKIYLFRLGLLKN